MLSNATNQPKSTVELGYMCPWGLLGPPDYYTEEIHKMTSLQLYCGYINIQGLVWLIVSGVGNNYDYRWWGMHDFICMDSAELFWTGRERKNSKRKYMSHIGPKAEGVPTNNQRGRGAEPCRLWRGLDKARQIVPTTLLVRVQRLRNDLCNAEKGPSTWPLVLSMIAGSYWRRRRRFTIFEPDNMNLVSPLTLLSLEIRSP